MLFYRSTGTYSGDILIGADGAYSTVRQCMYKDLDEKGLLPKEDKEEMSMAIISMLGITGPLDPAKYPVLKFAHSHFATVLGKGNPQLPHWWSTITTTGNRIAWSVSYAVDAQSAEKVKFRNEEWGPEANKAMMDEISNFPLVEGGVLKDLIDASDKNLISKVYIEEKLFQTWNHGRIALIGDGAVSAIQDACILLNSIYDLKDTTYESIKAALDEYPPQRRDRVTSQFKLSQRFGSVIVGQTLSDRIFRWVMFNLPKWVQRQRQEKNATYRPLITFLPPVPNNTNLKLLPQRPSKRYAREQAAKTTNEVTSV
ncbi:hypothetical protein BG000_007514 [Podila horticola]|nr:hypothetical protein BG000_007514 [Podila horticola]